MPIRENLEVVQILKLFTFSFKIPSRLFCLDCNSSISSSNLALSIFLPSISWLILLILWFSWFRLCCVAWNCLSTVLFFSNASIQVFLSLRKNLDQSVLGCPWPAWWTALFISVLTSSSLVMSRLSASLFFWSSCKQTKKYCQNWSTNNKTEKNFSLKGCAFKDKLWTQQQAFRNCLKISINLTSCQQERATKLFSVVAINRFDWNWQKNHQYSKVNNQI